MVWWEVSMIMGLMLFTKYSRSMNALDNIFIVIPAYNEEDRIGLVISELKQLGFNNIVVINDSSTDNTSEVSQSYANTIVINHLINLGPGGATQTGIEYSLNNGAEYIATIDADYQHDPKDILKLFYKIQHEELDIVVGSRFMKKNAIPKTRIFYNKVGNVINFMLTGKMMSDSQSGLKIFRSSLAKQLSLKTNGFEFCIELIRNANSVKAKIKEVPISVRYSEETMSKGQSLVSGFSMLGRLFTPFN